MGNPVPVLLTYRNASSLGGALAVAREARRTWSGFGGRGLADEWDRPPSSGARWLAIFGACITGAAGIAMAVYSVFAGEATGGGALLAASALAFGLLAVNIDRVPGQSGPSIEVSPENPSSNGQVDGALPSLDQAIAREEIAVDPLTKREQEVLALVAEGYANKQIGVELGIAERTVVNHITHTIGKLGASDRTHAVVTAIRMGWLDVKKQPVTSSEGKPTPR